MRQKLIIYSWELQNCPHYSRIFNSEYEIIIPKTETEFFNSIHNLSVDAAIICFCSALVDDVNKLVRLQALSCPVTVLTCSKILNPEFIRKATQRGVGRFLLCNMEREKIRDIINDAIRDRGLKEYFRSRWPNSLESSPHISKLVNEIIYVFPRRLEVKELAERVGIDRGWLHKLCKQTFGRPPTSLIRRIGFIRLCA